MEMLNTNTFLLYLKYNTSLSFSILSCHNDVVYHTCLREPGLRLRSSFMLPPQNHDVPLCVERFSLRRDR